MVLGAGSSTGPPAARRGVPTTRQHHRRHDGRLILIERGQAHGVAAAHVTHAVDAARPKAHPLAGGQPGDEGLIAGAFVGQGAAVAVAGGPVERPRDACGSDAGAVAIAGALPRERHAAVAGGARERGAVGPGAVDADGGGARARGAVAVGVFEEHPQGPRPVVAGGEAVFELRQVAHPARAVGGRVGVGGVGEAHPRDGAVIGGCDGHRDTQAVGPGGAVVEADLCDHRRVVLAGGGGLQLHAAGEVASGVAGAHAEVVGLAGQAGELHGGVCAVERSDAVGVTALRLHPVSRPNSASCERCAAM